MSLYKYLFIIALPALAASTIACIKLDFFMFEGTPANLDDYDFTSEELDGIPVERITSELIPSANPKQKIHIIYIERNAEKLDSRLNPDDNITVIFSHGQSDNMLSYFYRMGYFEDMGFNVLMYDYRGYGASDGETTEKTLYEDAQTAYDYLRAREDVGAVFAAGFSMGGTPTAWLCSPRSHRELKGCFTESAFASVDSLIDEGAGYDFESSWFVDGALDTRALFKDTTVPVLLMHGTEDPKVSFENAEKLWKAVQKNHPANTFYPIQGATHRNVPVPSYNPNKEPIEFSHPDEFGPVLAEEFELYKSRIVDFIVDAMNAPSN